MSSVEHLIPWDQQPQEAVEIDWSNPLTAGLTVLSVGNSRTNLVDGADQAEGGNWPSVATPGGIAAQSTSNIRGRYWTTPLVGAAGSTIFAVGIGQNTGSASCYGAYNGAAGSNIGYLLAIDGGLFRIYTLPGYGAASTARPPDGSVFTCAAVNLPGVADTFAWLNGQSFGSVLPTVSNLGRAGPAEILTNQSTDRAGASLLFAAWGRALSSDELRSLHANPWQLFPPRSICVPAAAGGGGGVVSVSPAGIASTANVRAPVVARVAVASVAPGRIESTASVRAPVVARVAAAAVSPARVEPASAVYAPTVARVAAAGVAPARVEPTSAVRAPVVARVAVAIAQPSRIESTSAVRAPAVSADGLASVAAPRIESTAVVRSPSVAAVGVRSVAPARIEPTSAVAAPQLQREAVVSVAPGRIESATAFGVPTIAASNVPQIIVGRIQSTAVVRSPTVQRLGAGGGADPAEVWSYVMANGRTAEQNVLDNNRMLRIVLAALSGQTAGIGTATETYFGEDGVTPRLVATFDSAGNRVSVLTDGSP